MAHVIQDMIDRGKSTPEIKAFIRYMTEKADHAVPSALSLSGLSDGDTFEFPETGLIGTRIDDTGTEEFSERRRIHKGPTAADSFFSMQNLSSKRKRFSFVDGTILGETTFGSPDETYAAFPDRDVYTRHIYPRDGEFRYIDDAGSNGSYSDFATASFPGFIIGSGDEGSFGYRVLKQDFNDPVEVNIAGADRLLYGVTSNSQTDGIFAADIWSGQVIKNQATGSSPNMTMEFVAVSGDARTPVTVPNITDNMDAGSIGPDGTHIVALINDGGAVVYEFDGTLMPTELLPTSPHTELFCYTFRDGSREMAIASKGTPGNPVTGEGDLFFRTYEFSTDGTTGARDVVVLGDIQGFDADPAVSQGYIGQLSANKIQDDYLLMMTDPDPAVSSSDYYAKNSAVLVPINERLIPPGETLYPILLVHHRTNTQTFAQQTEGNIGHHVRYPDANAGCQSITMRTNNLGGNTANYILHVRFGGIPLKTGTDDPDWVLWFSYASRVPMTNSGSDSISTGTELTFGTGTAEAGVGTITGYSWRIDGVESGTGSTLAHTFSTPGTYYVQGKVTDNAGKTWLTTAREIVVSPVGGSQSGTLKGNGAQSGFIKLPSPQAGYLKIA